MESKTEIGYGMFIVAFVDLLGQKERLARLGHPPDGNDKAAMEEFGKHVRSTYGAVRGFRTLFRSFFDGFVQRNAPTEMLTPQQRAVYEKATNPQIGIQTFSDCMAIFMPLRPQEDAQLPIRGVTGILYSLAGMQAIQLSLRIPLRGGVAIGPGFAASNYEIYGPVLAKAYELESSIAQYPRVVIDKSVEEYLASYGSCDGDEPLTKMARGVAESAIKYLIRDADGHAILDYLGPNYLPALLDAGNGVGYDIVQKAKSFVVEESVRLKNERKTKEAFRYSMLRSYFEYRLGALE